MFATMFVTIPTDGAGYLLDQFHSKKATSTRIVANMCICLWQYTVYGSYN